MVYGVYLVFSLSLFLPEMKIGGKLTSPLCDPPVVASAGSHPHGSRCPLPVMTRPLTPSRVGSRPFSPLLRVFFSDAAFPFLSLPHITFPLKPAPSTRPDHFLGRTTLIDWVPPLPLNSSPVWRLKRAFLSLRFRQRAVPRLLRLFSPLGRKHVPLLSFTPALRSSPGSPFPLCSIFLFSIIF